MATNYLRYQHKNIHRRIGSYRIYRFDYRRLQNQQKYRRKRICCSKNVGSDKSQPSLVKRIVSKVRNTQSHGLKFYVPCDYVFRTFATSIFFFGNLQFRLWIISVVFGSSKIPYAVRYMVWYYLLVKLFNQLFHILNKKLNSNHCLTEERFDKSDIFFLL